MLELRQSNCQGEPEAIGSEAYWKSQVMLVNVHIVSGSKDLALHLQGLTMRIPVMQKLIEILRGSGYPGYENDGVNSASRVANRMRERYGRYEQEYGTAAFTPAAVQEAVQREDNAKDSIVQDKVATPADAPATVTEWDRALRPHHIVAERSTPGQANIHENYHAVFGMFCEENKNKERSIFGKFGDVSITTGTRMVNQHNPWYLGMAFPFTIPCAVGGYDVPSQNRWRRPEDDDLPTDRDKLNGWLSPSTSSRHHKLPGEHFAVGPACKVHAGRESCRLLSIRG